MRYYDVFGEGGFHSAFMTTYSFGAQAFEAVPFWRLRGSGCNNITVLADAVMFNQEMSNFGAAQFAGSSYHVVKIHQGGAFHPKITVLLGEKKGRLLVGSANLTAAGLGGNRELVVDIRYDPEDSSRVNLFAEAIAYIQSKVPSDDPWFWAALDRALRRTPWLRGSSLGATDEAGRDDERLILDGPESSILQQFVAAIDGDRISRITVMSPYWDYQLKALKELSEAFGSPPIDILIDAEEGTFPADALGELGDVRVFDHEKLGGSRFVHAKLFVLHGEKADHVISGSINCSAPAMLDQTVKNSEAGIYSRVEPGNALGNLGLEAILGSPVDPSRLPSFVSLDTDTDANRARYRDGGELVRKDDVLEWKPARNAKIEPVSLTLFARNAQPVGEPRLLKSIRKRRWSLELEGDRPHYGVVMFSDDVHSAPVPVIDLSLLPRTTEPAGGGKRNRIVDSLVDLELEDLTLFEALAQLEALERDGNDLANIPRARRERKQETDTGDSRRSKLSYDEFVKGREDQGSQPGGEAGSIMAGLSDRPADMVSECLNRLIGLVSSGQLDSEIDALRDHEKAPETPNEGDNGADDDDGNDETPSPEIGNSTVTITRVRPAKSMAVQDAIRQAQKDHAKKIKQAVVAYERHCQSLGDKPIDTAELVRLRVLLHVVLRYARPAEGEAAQHQVLPVYDSSMMGWPRLVGRLMNQHFGRLQLIQRLEVADDDTEQNRVIEYLATALWAAKSALFALNDVRQAGPVLAALRKITTNVQALLLFVVGSNENDRAYLETLLSRLDEQFGLSLNYLVTDEGLNAILGTDAERQEEGRSSSRD